MDQDGAGSPGSTNDYPYLSLSDALLTCRDVSFDPDVTPDDKSGLQFEWFCWILNDGADFSTIDKDNTVFIPPVELKDNYTDGGCFGTGLGKINITDGILT